MSSETPTRAQLLRTAQALCSAFAAKADISTLLSHFSSTHQISAYEHGLPVLAPFLGRPFTGRAGPTSVRAYFELLQQHLTYENVEFGEWVVDEAAARVTVVGSAKFTWNEGKGTGQTWEECFIYMLDFDQAAKVTDYQVWADSGAAYLARVGELGQLIAASKVCVCVGGACAPLACVGRVLRNGVAYRSPVRTMRAIPRRLSTSNCPLWPIPRRECTNKVVHLTVWCIRISGICTRTRVVCTHCISRPYLSILWTLDHPSIQDTMRFSRTNQPAALSCITSRQAFPGPSSAIQNVDCPWKRGPVACSFAVDHIGPALLWR
ncbi:hypothetical protein C8Q70DRAFT_253072 [Cubamyces menziesii]|nr:hypothetical protein C8Q70DRAFT_253072 [Cubamyces menziesii]